MELVYRIQKREFAQDRNSILSGYGAFLHGGRWNPKGTPLVYASATPELAALEYKVQIVGIPHDRVPPLVLITLQVPDSFIIPKKDELPLKWDDEFNTSQTENYTKDWLRKKEFLAMKIPSVIVKQSLNILINPEHPLINEVNIIEIEDFSFNQRLFIKDEPFQMENLILDILDF